MPAVRYNSPVCSTADYTINHRLIPHSGTDSHPTNAGRLHRQPSRPGYGR